MPVLPDLRDPCDALDKLARERLRVLGATNDVEIVDHFLNFCITGWALGDYVKHAFHLLGAAEQNAYSVWLGNPLIAACRDIANRTKHFQLDKKATTREVRISKRGVVDVYANEKGDLFPELRENAPVIEVVLDNGTHHDMWEFLHGVITYWENDLRTRGLECP